MKYVLRGSLLDSGFVGNGTIKFTNLSPGNYTLTAFPFMQTGEKLQINIPFSVLPAFWQTALFQIAAVFVLLLMLTLIVWLIIRYYRKKEAVKTKNEQLILEYKLIALKAQINPHFMSNCLSAIQHLIMSNKTERATFYVAKFGFMVRQILDFSSKPIITLAEELDLLNVYIELEQLRFENKFMFELKVEETIALKETFVPPLLLNPIVENAIWHGLLPLQNQRNRELSIGIKNENAHLIISIKDNGVGRSAKKENISNTKTESYGIKITEQRLSNINYLYKSHEAKIVYSDLVDSDNKPNGTLVTIYLPDNLKPAESEEE